MADGRFVPDLSKWKAWSPAEVAERLEGVDTPWFVTAGWAIDLSVGRETRDHEDIEIAVGQTGWDQIRRALGGHEFVVVGDGYAWPDTPSARADHHQTWVREVDTGFWRLDVFREPWDGDLWVFRRDRSISRPLALVIEYTADGIPYAAPEIVLLFKAKAAREKDEADLEVALPLLSAEQRRWLADALAAVHPGHAWLERLRG